jgi:hypothetical protein
MRKLKGSLTLDYLIKCWENRFILGFDSSCITLGCYVILTIDFDSLPQHSCLSTQDIFSLYNTNQFQL